MDRLDRVEFGLSWTIKIGAVVAAILLVLGYDASYQARVVKKQVQQQSEDNRKWVDSLLRVYLGDDSLKVRK